ncbi:MAG TPA: acylneuraminate cytidylyltransferase family protein [Anaerolineae bacterium]|nr:acylneuraminate cytidylyltransferase family protein [Anaerolineae bacterium]
MVKSPRVVALIPARSGSKRVVGKNIRPLDGHPLIAYSIAAAQQSNIFDKVIVSTDSEEYAHIAQHYGADVPFLRPTQFAADLSPDIEWVEHALTELRASGQPFDCFSILRPTSPFRQPETIQRAWNQFTADENVDSLRAVEKCKQHPGKMWVVHGNRMIPLLPLQPKEQPWHSSQYQALPKVYVQNASLEIAWSRVVFDGRTIAGEIVMPFFTEGYEGVDVNEERDFWYAEYLLKQGLAHLPRISQEPIFS